jgi:MFS family permease
VSPRALDEQRRIRRGRRLLRVLVVAVMLGLGIAVLVLGVWLDLTGSPIWEREPPWWVSILGAVVAVAGLVVQIAAIVFVVRASRRWANRPSSLRVLSWSRQRELMRKVRRGGEVDEEELPLLRDAAHVMASQRWWIAAFAGQTASQVGLIAMNPDDVARVRLVFVVVMVALLAVGGALIGRDARRVEAFLRTNPAPGEESQDPTTSQV